MEYEYRLISYNMRGFNQGQFLLPSLLATCDILLVQEHWLCPNELDRLNINNNFIVFSESSMDHATSTNILRGRPYGGLGIYVHKSVQCDIKCGFSNDRCLIIRLGNLILCNVYFPCDSNPNCYSIYMHTLASIENYLSDVEYSQIIIGGDFNIDRGRVRGSGEKCCYSLLW
jgi:exonuclease III